MSWDEFWRGEWCNGSVFLFGPTDHLMKLAKKIANIVK